MFGAKTMTFMGLIHLYHWSSTLPSRRGGLRRAYEGDAHDLGQGPADQGSLKLVRHLRGSQTEVAARGTQHHIHGALENNWGVHIKCLHACNK